MTRFAQGCVLIALLACQGNEPERSSGRHLNFSGIANGGTGLPMYSDTREAAFNALPMLNSSTEDVILEGATILRGAPSISLIEVEMLATNNSPGFFGECVVSWPLRRWQTRPLQGHHLKPGATVSIVVRLRRNEEPPGKIEVIRFLYRTGKGTRHYADVRYNVGWSNRKGGRCEDVPPAIFPTDPSGRSEP